MWGKTDEGFWSGSFDAEEILMIIFFGLDLSVGENG